MFYILSKERKNFSVWNLLNVKHCDNYQSFSPDLSNFWFQIFTLDYCQVLINGHFWDEFEGQFNSKGWLNEPPIDARID